MNTNELYSELEKIGLPVAYLCFDEKQKKEYIVYYFRSQVEGSDNENELVHYDYTIELYTQQKNFAIENRIIAILDEKGVDYEIDGSIYIESEKRLMTVITFSFLMLKED